MMFSDMIKIDIHAISIKAKTIKGVFTINENIKIFSLMSLRINKKLNRTVLAG